MPRGSQLGQFFGGPAAITDETESGWLVEHAVIAVNSKKPSKVKRRPYPEGIYEQEQQQAHFESQAHAWREKQRQRREAQQRKDEQP
ncbi:hypothetical protein K8P10_001991 [Leucobacter sp. Psy1]|uniref:hypothetical protein n=1 Tax=Leucobacter sp. Psy1 TaxID=2875729 RepID=UPI001CD58549|nr:hypothetical protein [Leucobacter sp. Psy1]UBH06480.1 hypothetical protein K8P10_001991 [Leucobacter sp. Psy1]